MNCFSASFLWIFMRCMLLNFHSRYFHRIQDANRISWRLIPSHNTFQLVVGDATASMGNRMSMNPSYERNRKEDRVWVLLWDFRPSIDWTPTYLFFSFRFTLPYFLIRFWYLLNKSKMNKLESRHLNDFLEVNLVYCSVEWKFLKWSGYSIFFEADFK